MDLTAVTSVRRARSRDDLWLAPGETYLAGGTWLYSEDQPGLTGLVDLTGLGWDRIESLPSGGVRIGAMVTIADLVAWAAASALPSAPLVTACAQGMLASFKVTNSATVGGNIMRAYAAGSMIALAATLDATAAIWRADGNDARLPVADIPTGNGTTMLRPDDVLRAIDIPATALHAHTASRKIALAQYGRSGALVTGRLDVDGEVTLVVTAATATPSVLRFDTLPTADAVVASAQSLTGYYTDPLGSADWRRQVTGVLLAEVLDELAS